MAAFAATFSSRGDGICLINNLLSHVASAGYELSLLFSGGVAEGYEPHRNSGSLSPGAPRRQSAAAGGGWGGRVKWKPAWLSAEPESYTAWLCFRILNYLKGLYHRRSKLIHNGPFQWLPRASCACNQDRRHSRVRSLGTDTRLILPSIPVRRHYPSRGRWKMSHFIYASISPHV